MERPKSMKCLADQPLAQHPWKPPGSPAMSHYLISPSPHGYSNNIGRVWIHLLPSGTTEISLGQLTWQESASSCECLRSRGGGKELRSELLQRPFTCVSGIKAQKEGLRPRQECKRSKYLSWNDSKWENPEWPNRVSLQKKETMLLKQQNKTNPSSVSFHPNISGSSQLLLNTHLIKLDMLSFSNQSKFLAMTSLWPIRSDLKLEFLCLQTQWAPKTSCLLEVVWK